MKISVERLKEIIQEEVATTNEEDDLSEGTLDVFKKEPESDIHRIIRYLHDARSVLHRGEKWNNPIAEELRLHYINMKPLSIELSVDTTYKMLLSPLMNFFKELEKQEAEAEVEEEQ